MASIFNAIIPVTTNPLKYPIPTDAVGFSTAYNAQGAAVVAAGYSGHVAVTKKENKAGTGVKGYIGTPAAGVAGAAGVLAAGLAGAAGVVAAGAAGVAPAFNTAFTQLGLSHHTFANSLLRDLVAYANATAIGGADTATFQNGLLDIARTHIEIYYTAVLALVPGGVAGFMAQRYDAIIAAGNAGAEWLLRRTEHAANPNKCLIDAVATLSNDNLLKIDFGTKYTKLTRALFPKVAENEELDSFPVRDYIYEMAPPPEQCGRVIGSAKASDKCWICSKPIFGGKGLPTAQCEHILSILPATKYLLLVQTKFNQTYKQFDTATRKLIDEILKLEYRWSHKCCNQIKNDDNFLMLNSIFQFKQNDANITEVLDGIRDSLSDDYACSKITKLKADLKANSATRAAIITADLAPTITKVKTCLDSQKTIFSSLCGGDLKGDHVFNAFSICRFFYNIPFRRMYCLLTGGPYPFTGRTVNERIDTTAIGILVGGDRRGMKTTEDKILDEIANEVDKIKKKPHSFEATEEQNEEEEKKKKRTNK